MLLFSLISQVLFYMYQQCLIYCTKSFEKIIYFMFLLI